MERERAKPLEGSAGTLKNGYVRNVPLPRAPQIQSASHVTNQSQGNAHKYASDRHVTNWPHTNTCYSQESRVPMWYDLVRLLEVWGVTFSPLSLFS